MANKNNPARPLYVEQEFNVPFHIHSVRWTVICEVAWDLWWSVDGVTWTKWSEYAEEDYQEPFIAVPINNSPLNALYQIHVDEITSTKARISE